MNRSDLKKLAAYLSVIAILGIAYYGNYMPLRKSQSYIYMTRQLSAVKSWDQLKEIAEEPLTKPSPIGQEEIVRSFVNMLVSLLRSNESPELAVAIMDYVHRHYDPIIARGKGMSFQQNLYVLGLMNEIVFMQTKNPSYLNDAGSYFERGLAEAPKRPQSMYGLMDVYRLKNEREKAIELANRILSLWPTDENVRGVLQGK